MKITKPGEEEREVIVIPNEEPIFAPEPAEPATN